MNNSKGVHLKGLNGLRALAALSVLISHTFQNTFANWGINGVKLPLFSDGVTLFFVISGFLITYLLLIEKDKRDTVSIPQFYMRRILRIWPIYYMYIAIAIFVCVAYGLSDSILNNTLFYYIFFIANIPFLSASGIWIIVHFWSIGVEEQFYLFWPWIVKCTKKRLLKGALIILFGWLFCKYGSWFLFTNKSLIYKFFAVTRFHCMMLGAVGAIFFYRHNMVFLKCLTNRYVQIGAWILFLFSGIYLDYVPAVIHSEFIAVVSLILIVGQVCDNSIFSLENKPFDFVGKISYGIYVIHPLLLFLFSRLFCYLKLNMLDVSIYSMSFLIYLFMILSTIVIAWLSYNFYERPFLKLKSKFAVIKSRVTIN